jgi:hypothetical protein
MEIFGFICMILLLVAFTCGWFFVFLMDGAFGSRDIPIYVMLAILVAVIFMWISVLGKSPFVVTLAT